MTDQDAAARQAAELLPYCSNHNNVEQYIAVRRPAVAAALRERDAKIIVFEESVAGMQRTIHSYVERIAELVAASDDQNGAPCEQIRHQQEVEQLRERIAALDAQIANAKKNACHGEWPCEASTECASLEAENERLRVALVPFAKMAEGKDKWPDEDGGCAVFPSMKEVRDARAALAGRKPNG